MPFILSVVSFVTGRQHTARQPWHTDQGVKCNAQHRHYARHVLGKHNRPAYMRSGHQDMGLQRPCACVCVSTHVLNATTCLCTFTDNIRTYNLAALACRLPYGLISPLISGRVRVVSAAAADHQPQQHH
jgi:hypothetical protein